MRGRGMTWAPGTTRCAMRRKASCARSRPTALFMADFLEPGRGFAKADRAFLASLLPRDFDGVFRQVVRMRMEWTLREGNALFPQTVELWNSIR